MVFFLFSSLFSNPCLSILSQMLLTDKCTDWSDSECDKDVQEECEPIMERWTSTVHCLINWTLDSEQVTDTSRQHLCSHSTPLASAKLQHTGSFVFSLPIIFTALMFAWNDIKPTLQQSKFTLIAILTVLGMCCLNVTLIPHLSLEQGHWN